MFKNIFLLVGVVVLITGCATGRKNVASENQALQLRVAELETQLQQKDEEIASLQEKFTSSDTYGAAKRSLLVKPIPKRIQSALKNAGFYKGTVDGKIGKKTREAIAEFQKANGLKPDTIVGEQTWAKLSEYLSNE